jgi:hypothetical protein
MKRIPLQQLSSPPSPSNDPSPPSTNGSNHQHHHRSTHKTKKSTQTSTTTTGGGLLVKTNKMKRFVSPIRTVGSQQQQMLGTAGTTMMKNDTHTNRILTPQSFRQVSTEEKSLTISGSGKDSRTKRPRI